MIIKLVRHGESEANTGEVNPQEIGDHAVKLSALGKEQAFQAGVAIGPGFLRDALLFCSPYTRTRETMRGVLRGAGFSHDTPGVCVPRILEDPRLREVEHGYGDDINEQHSDRLLHGWFYYRFKRGESPADCYDRSSAFLETMWRQTQRRGTRRVLIVSHGLTIRCIAMRFLHLSVEQFETLDNPRNCDVITIAPTDMLDPDDIVFRTSRWGVTGLRLRVS
jgi:broad specificity phosphatase PhoE